MLASVPARALILLIASATITSAQERGYPVCKSGVAMFGSDSVDTQIGLRILSFEKRPRLPDDFAALLTQEIRHQLKLPAPLPLDVYMRRRGHTNNGTAADAAGGDVAVPTLFGAYRATLTPKGRLTNLRVVGGARTTTFDVAFLQALKGASDSGATVPYSDDDVELSFIVEPVQFHEDTLIKPAIAPPEPLFRLRVPIAVQSVPLYLLSGDPPLYYPVDARLAKIQGVTVVQVVVDPEGRVDMNSVQVVQAPALSFAKVVYEVLPQMRFAPTMVYGCSVPTVERLPFTFRLID